MADTLDAQALAALLDDLLAYLKNNPDADLEDFAESHGCSVDDISDSWNTYFSADFSRKYDIDTDYHPSHPPHGGDEKALKEYIVKEVNSYQHYTTVNNITDNSFNQQIIAGGDVNQDIDIDNSTNVADDGGVLIRDSDVDDSNIVTGDRNVVDSDGNAVTGDVSTSADDGSQAATNFNFGDGDVDNRLQNADVDVTNNGDNFADGGAGGASDQDVNSSATSGDGGAGGSGDDGGNGGDGIDGDPFLGLGAGGDGGDGGDGGAGGDSNAANSTSASSDGGDGGDGGTAGNDSNVNIQF